MRRRWKVLLSLAAAAGVAAVTAPLWVPFAAKLAEPWIRQRILAIADDLLEPRVEIGRFDYHYPFGVDIVDLRLVATDADGGETTILDATTVGIVLDELPLTGPIVFRDFRLQDATLRFIATKDGSMVGWSDLLSGESSAGENGRPASEIFAIDLISVSGLDLEYAIAGDDRRMNLDDLEFEIDNKARKGDDRIDLGKGPGWYAIDTELKREGLFDIVIDGGLDIDTLDVELAKLELDLTLDDDAAGHLPPQIQDVVVQRKVEGRVDATFSGRFNLDDPDHDDTRFDVVFRPTHFAFDDYLVEIDAATIAGRYEAEVLRIDPCTVDLFGGRVNLALKVADETRRGLPGEEKVPDAPAPTPPDLPASDNIDARIAAAQSATDGLVPEAAFEAALSAAEAIHAFGTIDVQDIQLANIHRVDQADPSKIAGVVDASVEVDLNLGRPLASAGGGGELRISEGRFTGGPIVKALASVMRIVTLSPKQTDEFETTFIIRDERIDISAFSMLAGPIGARGRGTVGFDGTLDLRMNAGPLEGLQASAGKVGELLGSLTDRLAKYLVRGTISDPKVTVAPLGIDIFGR